MLRSILGKGRAAIEPFDDDSSQTDSTASSCSSKEVMESWADWIKRVTSEATDAMEKACVPDWVEEQKRRKWTWRGHTCRRTEGRWSRKILEWTPTQGTRGRGHPKTRWSDDIDQFVSELLSQNRAITVADFSTWSEMALEQTVWKLLKEDCIKLIHKVMKILFLLVYLNSCWMIVFAPVLIMTPSPFMVKGG